MDLFEILKKELGDDKIIKNKDLFTYSTLRIKALAQFFIEAKTRDDLIKIKRVSLNYKIPFLFIAGGSNIVFVKEKKYKLVVKNSYTKKQVIRENSDYVDLLISSGYPMPKIVSETIEAGWEGFEYHKGLPGTLGGAIYMNSKWIKPLSYISDNLIYAWLIDNRGQIKKVNHDYFKFSYGLSSIQKTKELLIEAMFRLKKIQPSILKKRASSSLKYRIETQPQGFSSGCFFKNPSHKSAGYLIEKVGLKGFSIGSFYISDKHANFIINKSYGNGKDLKKLIKMIKDKVKQRFNVKLKEEVILV